MKFDIVRSLVWAIMAAMIVVFWVTVIPVVFGVIGDLISASAQRPSACERYTAECTAVMEIYQ